MDDVNAAVKTLREGGDVRMQHHIGGAHYTSVTSGYKCVDLRKFYKPDDPIEGDIKPSRRGVALRLDQWATLCQLVESIHAAFPITCGLSVCLSSVMLKMSDKQMLFVCFSS